MSATVASISASVKVRAVSCISTRIARLFFPDPSSVPDRHRTSRYAPHARVGRHSASTSCCAGTASSTTTAKSRRTIGNRETACAAGSGAQSGSSSSSKTTGALRQFKARATGAGAARRSSRLARIQHPGRAARMKRRVRGRLGHHRQRRGQRLDVAFDVEEIDAALAAVPLFGQRRAERQARDSLRLRIFVASAKEATTALENAHPFLFAIDVGPKDVDAVRRAAWYASRPGGLRSGFEP